MTSPNNVFNIATGYGDCVSLGINRYKGHRFFVISYEDTQFCYKISPDCNLQKIRRNFDDFFPMLQQMSWYERGSCIQYATVDDSTALQMVEFGDFLATYDIDIIY